MHALKTWAISFSGACIGAGVIFFLKPSMKFERLMRLAITAFLILSFLMPFTRGVQLHFPALPSQQDSRELLQKQARDLLEKEQIDAAAAQVKAALDKGLREKGYVFKEIEVSMNIDEKDNIVINEIKVVGAARAQMQRIHDYIKKVWKLEAVVSEDV